MIISITPTTHAPPAKPTQNSVTVDDASPLYRAVTVAAIAMASRDLGILIFKDGVRFATVNLRGDGDKYAVSRYGNGARGGGITNYATPGEVFDAIK